MKKVIIFLLLIFCLVDYNNAQGLCEIDPDLQQLMDQKNDDLISVNIIFKSQIDVKKLNSRERSFSDRGAKKEAVLKEFKKFSETSQADVLSILQAETRSNSVKDIKCHWITNMINCKVTGDVVYQLAEHPDIKAIAYNKLEYMLFDEEIQEADAVRGLTENIKKINADDAWNCGYTGKGVVVSVLDTGVNTNHIDLKDHLWDGGSQYPNHGYNALDDNNDVTDNHGHGTHCAGTVCGDGTSGMKTGMAPDATLMCVKVLGADGKGSVDAMVSGVEFSVENGADVLSISLGLSFPEPYYSSVFRYTFENLLEFDIVASVAAGNDRDKLDEFPIPRNVNAPGNCPPPWIHPDQRANIGGVSSVICVGAVDNNDEYAYFSSEGPVTWSGSEWNDYPLNMATNLEPGWLNYDDGVFSSSIAGAKSFSWGVMFPPSKLQDYENGVLTKVSMFDCLQCTGEIEIYQGGNNPSKGTLLHKQTYSCTGSNSFVEFDLTTQLTIDKDKNLWVILKTNSGEYGPAASCGLLGDPNGRWYGTHIGNYTKWEDACNLGLNCTWMIRAFIADDNGRVAELASNDNEYGLIRPDVSAPGLYIVSCAHNSNSGQAIMSGTSMATPCVTGAIALLLEKYPNLTPARICEALETSAVKLTDKKSNKTGSGRIDVMAAMAFLDEPEPVLPEAPVLTAEAISSSEIALSWNAVEGAINYNVYYERELLGTVEGNNTDIMVTGLSPEYEYCFTLTVSVENGESDHSNEACATTLAEEPMPTIPEAPVVTATASNDTIYLIWEAVENALYYTLYYADEQLITLEDTIVAVKIIEPGTYCMTVTASNDFGESEHSNEACATIEANQEMEIPEAPVLTATIENDSAVLKWEAVELATYYNVYFEGQLLGATVNTEVRLALETFGKYCFTVTSANMKGESEHSNEACVTKEMPCLSPENLVAEVVDAYSISLAWDAQSCADSYNVYRDGELLANVNDVNYTDTDLEASVEYCYTIVSVCGANLSTSSEEACAITLSGENISDITTSLGIYPNPVEDKLVIITSEIIKKIRIYNIVGMTVYSNEENVTSIDVTNFNSGVYFINIKTYSGEVTKQFIKK